MAEVLLASGNTHKLEEFRELFAGLPVRVLGPADWQARGHPPLPDVAETGLTFLDNALLKAASACRATGLTCVADDSGLAVDALGGKPGVNSARYAGPDATDADNRALLLENLADIADRRAAFHCVLVVCGPLAEGPDCGRTEDGLPWRAFSGVGEGTILTEAIGAGGFGYDSLFHHEALGRTFAEATSAEKHALSHRGHAFEQLKTWLAAIQVTSHAGNPDKVRKPLYVRAIGLTTLTTALERTLAKRLRYADAALETALVEQPTLGSKERAAVGHLHWYTLRHLSFLQIATRAVAGDRPPSEPPDPRTLAARDGPLLAALALSDVDALGDPRDHTKKAGPPSALAGLAARTPQLRLPMPTDQADSVLRAATYAVRAMPDEARQALELGYPLAFLQACREELGDVHALAALNYLNGRGPLTVRANRLKTNRDKLAEVLAEAGVATVALDDLPDALLCLEPGRLTTLAQYEAGWFEIQDEGSQRIVAAVQAQAGQIVLDWCAGAGGKTLGLAAALAGTGTLIALDTHKARLAECRRRLDRAGCEAVETRQLSASGAMDLPLADAVLVDAPCTSSGALRRNPELRWHLDRDWLTSFAPQQLSILRRASEFVKPGGRLVYATCSLLRRENEDVVTFFTQEARHFRISDDHRHGPASAAYLAQHPLAQVGPDGFYCCVLRRDP